MSLGFFRWILCRSPEFRAKRAMGVSTSFFSFSSNEPGDGPRWGEPGKITPLLQRGSQVRSPQVERYTVSVCTHTHTPPSLSLSLWLFFTPPDQSGLRNGLGGSNMKLNDEAARRCAKGEDAMPARAPTTPLGWRGSGGSVPKAWVSYNKMVHSCNT